MFCSAKRDRVPTWGQGMIDNLETAKEGEKECACRIWALCIGRVATLGEWGQRGCAEGSMEKVGFEEGSKRRED